VTDAYSHASITDRATFIVDFQPSGTAMDVYAGLITPDLRVLGLMTSADLAMFCSQWTASLLSHPMNAVPWAMDGCSEDQGCRAMIMPGAIALARAVRPMLNTSVYFDDLFAKDEILRLDNVTAMIARYDDATATGELTFDVESECVYTGYQGLAKANGFQICMKQEGLSMLAGSFTFRFHFQLLTMRKPRSKNQLTPSQAG